MKAWRPVSQAIDAQPAVLLAERQNILSDTEAASDAMALVCMTRIHADHQHKSEKEDETSHNGR